MPLPWLLGSIKLLVPSGFLMNSILLLHCLGASLPLLATLQATVAQVVISSVLHLYLNSEMQSNVKTKRTYSKQLSSPGLSQISVRHFTPLGPRNLPGPQQREVSSKTFKIMLGFVIAALRKLADCSPHPTPFPHPCQLS